MSTWQVTERASGTVVYAYDAESPTEWQEYPFSEFNHILHVPELEAPIQRTLTKRAYLGRFTAEERVAIRTAAKQSVALEDYLELLALSEDINLDDPDLIAGLAMLEGAGLIAPGRAAEIRA